MLYWAITIQSNESVETIYLTTSFKKANKKKELLEKELLEKNIDKVYYYLNSVKLGE